MCKNFAIFITLFTVFFYIKFNYLINYVLYDFRDILYVIIFLLLRIIILIPIATLCNNDGIDVIAFWILVNLIFFKLNFLYGFKY